MNNYIFLVNQVSLNNRPVVQSDVMARTHEVHNLNNVYRIVSTWLCLYAIMFVVFYVLSLILGSQQEKSTDSTPHVSVCLVSVPAPQSIGTDSSGTRLLSTKASSTLMRQFLVQMRWGYWHKTSRPAPLVTDLVRTTVTWEDTVSHHRRPADQCSKSCEDVWYPRGH